MSAALLDIVIPVIMQVLNRCAFNFKFNSISDSTKYQTPNYEKIGLKM